MYTYIYIYIYIYIYTYVHIYVYVYMSGLEAPPALLPRVFRFFRYMYAHNNQSYNNSLLILIYNPLGDCQCVVYVLLNQSLLLYGYMHVLLMYVNEIGPAPEPLEVLGEHKPGRIKPGRIKRAALSLRNQNCYMFLFFDATPFICL